MIFISIAYRLTIILVCNTVHICIVYITGQVAMSIAGRRSTNSISLAALIGQAFSFLGNSSPLALFWGLTVILFQRSFDIPPEDDITPIVSTSEENNKGLPYYLRGFILAFCIIMTAGMILPVPIDPATLANNGDIFLLPPLSL